MENKRLKILIVTDSVPYPLDRGGKICLFNFVDFLNTTHYFTLLVPCYSPETKEHSKKLKKLWPNVSIEMADFTTAEENGSGSGFFIRLLQFSRRKIDSLLNKIVYKGDKNYQNKLDFTTPFRPHSEIFLTALKKVCQTTNFDIIQVQYPRNLNIISALPLKPKKIFEQIESQFDVIKDFAKTKNLDPDYANYLVKNSEILENAFINQYDAVFTLNKMDTVYFNSKSITPKVFTSPFGVLNNDILKAPSFSVKPKKLVFSGNEAHYPNVDALQWYLEKIHKNIFEKHKFILHITGTWSEEAKTHFKNTSPGIKFEGVVDNYSAFLQESIMIVPIRIGGGGLRTKILYAMANAVPVVTTAIGAFGIEGKSNEHFCVADSETDFLNAISALITDTKISERVTQNGYDLVCEKYSQSKTSELRNLYYNEITSG